MPPRLFDVIVLGIGAMGASTAFELARRGRRVLGLEQFVPGHDRGSSHGQTRVIRKAYFEHPAYVPLLHRTYERWYELEQLQGKHLFTRCGCLSLGRPESELVAGVRQSAAEHGLKIENLDAAELRRRYPAFRLEDDIVGVLERDAGFLYVEECVRAYADEARESGAEIHVNEPATAWEASGSGVTVRTVRESYTADRLIITAGAWAGQLLRDLGPPLAVRRKVLLWYATEDDRLFRRDAFPIYLAEMDGGFYYGFPVIDEYGHKTARHDGGHEVSNPATVNRDVTPADEADCRAFLNRHLPGVRGPLRHSRVCLYTMTPDQHFIIDLHPRWPQVAIAAGFSGHGFKFAAVIGAILADLAEQGRTELPTDMFRLNRFSPRASELGKQDSDS